MTARLTHGLNAALGRILPERRLFLKSDSETRFIRLRPSTQALMLGGTALLLGWTVVSTTLLMLDSLGSGNLREQTRREQAVYEERLNVLAAERDQRAMEAATAQTRFSMALERISAMQGQILAEGEARRELEQGLAAVQGTLRRTMAERETARVRADGLARQIAEADRAQPGHRDAAETLDFVTAALAETARDRDHLAGLAEQNRREAETLALEGRLQRERNDQILTRLEEAVTVSMSPLDKMFRAAGLSSDRLLSQIRKGYSGQGGPLSPISYSTKSVPIDDATVRANGILQQLDEMNLYRLAAEKAPFAMPVNTAFRYTSGFGGRSDPFGRGHRRHEGVDLAGAHGSPILATADGVVVKAGWGSGYGQMVQIRHEFGLETVYGHMSRIRVKVGQKVSRGDRIGDMGSTGRSTGTHLHYEVRVGGNPVNPMNFIMAAKDVL